MKIILSRKGFDSGNEGYSPILPDGTLLSFPIPDETSGLKYSDIYYQGKSFLELWKNLKPKMSDFPEHCHLDPDIRPNLRELDEWQPAFGQCEKAQCHLANCGVQEGDLFIFFGSFRRTEEYKGSIRYIQDARPMHVIYGYLQIGKILKDYSMINKYYWHPHASEIRRSDPTNTLYLAAERLSLCDNTPGFGVFTYNDKRRLTAAENNKTATWKYHDWYSPDMIYENRKNSSKTPGRLFYAGQWQEIVLRESSEAEAWAKEVIIA